MTSASARHPKIFEANKFEEYSDDHRRKQYGDYFNFGKLHYPRKLELQENGSKVITANVVSLTPAPLDELLLTPPEGAIARRFCADEKFAVPIRKPAPLYPEAASRNRLVGETLVAMTVQLDGSVSDIHLVGRAAHDMDDATLKVLKGWKFKPAMCGTEPVVSDVVVVMMFRIQN